MGEQSSEKEVICDSVNESCPSDCPHREVHERSLFCESYNCPNIGDLTQCIEAEELLWVCNSVTEKCNRRYCRHKTPHKHTDQCGDEECTERTAPVCCVPIPPKHNSILTRTEGYVKTNKKWSLDKEGKLNMNEIDPPRPIHRAIEPIKSGDYVAIVDDCAVKATPEEILDKVLYETLHKALTSTITCLSAEPIIEALKTNILDSLDLRLK